MHTLESINIFRGNNEDDGEEEEVEEYASKAYMLWAKRASYLQELEF